MKLLVCTMKRPPPLSACGNHGSEKIFDALKVKLSGVSQSFEVEQIKCLGYCDYGPNVRIPSKGKMWSEVKENALEDIIEYCTSNKPGFAVVPAGDDSHHFGQQVLLRYLPFLITPKLN